jgi:hypothetical protein
LADISGQGGLACQNRGNREGARTLDRREDQARRAVEAEGALWRAVRSTRLQRRADADRDSDEADAFLNRPPGTVIDESGTKVGVLKKWEHLIGDAEGLGIYFRLRVAYLASGLTQPNLAKQCRILRKRLEENLQYGSSRWLSGVWERVARFAADQIRGGDKKFSITEFRETPFHGPTALYDFLVWLRTGELSIKNYDFYLQKVDHISFIDEGSGRRRLLQTIDSFLKSDGLQNILVVYHASQSFGLTSLAAYICRKMITGDEVLQHRRFCYLPFARYIIQDRPFKLADIIATLDAFYGGRTEDGVPVPQSSRQMRDAIRRIRRGMSRHPAILIFDGCFDAANDITPLKRLVADDPLASVVNALLYAWVEPSDNWDPIRFSIRVSSSWRTGRVRNLMSFEQVPRS